MADTERRAVLLDAATSDIGREIARALSAAGAEVALVGSDVDALRLLAAECGSGAVAVPVGRRETEVTDVLVQTIVERFGGIGTCVLIPAHAGGGSAREGDLQVWEAMFQHDLWEPLLLAKAAVKAMLNQRPRGGRLVVVNPAGRGILPDDPVYCGLCWGLATFAESIRLTYTTDDIRVTVLETGAAYTSGDGPFEPTQPAAVAQALLGIMREPNRVSINELVIRPFGRQNEA